MPPKKSKKTAIKTRSTTKKDAPIANGVSSLPKEASLSPSRKRAPPDATNEPVGKKIKEDPATPTKRTSPTPTTERFPSPPDVPATRFDQATWQGFCEIESDPGYFSVMLREMGVKDVTVRDAFALDSESLAELPQPIYGLVLLFRARQVNSKDQVKKCPPNVWFANQLPGQNSCATVAMINTLMNYNTVIDIGEHLRQFYNFTGKLTPYQRGEALASFDFVKKIHNSFAKKMDILENDKHLAAKVAKTSGKKRAGLKKTQSSRYSSEDSNTSTESFEDNAHHFIAYVPIDDEIWKLDGMDQQPTRVGEYSMEPGNDWLTNTAEHISKIMAVGDNEYSVIAIAQAPVACLRSGMCNSIATFKHAKKRISTINTDWASFLPAPEPGVDPAEPMSPRILESIGVFEDMLEKATVPTDVSKAIDTDEFPELLQRCAGLCEEQINLRDRILVEIDNEEDENRKASERRTDLGPLIKKWCEMLAENGYLEENLDRFMPEETKKKQVAKKGKK